MQRILSDIERIERRRASRRKWEISHPVQMKAQRKRHKAAHRDKESARFRRYYEKHSAFLKERSRIYKMADPERAKVRDRLWRQTENGKLSDKLHHMKRRDATRDKPSASLKELSAITARQRGRCFYCNMKTKLTLDHVIPLSKDGSNTAENIVFACLHCNTAKGSRIWRIC